jgi:hypothetical protein
MTLAIALLLAFMTPTGAWAQDPAKTDSDKYKVVLENERVRILEYRDKPGEKTTMHAHPDFVVVTQSAFRRRLTLPGGKTLVREFKSGEVLWTDAQSHIGNTDTHVLIIELKEPRK